MKYKTDLNVIVDYSGSMAPLVKDVIGGFNTFLREQKESGESARISFYQFNTIYTPVYEDRNLCEAGELNKSNYKPSGGTALLDAVCTTIERVGARLSKMKPFERPKQVLVVVITDGEENSSRKFTKLNLEEKVKHQTDKYSWQFVYIGANLEAIHAGNAYTAIRSQVDERKLYAGGMLNTPGEAMYNSFKVASEGTKMYRSSESTTVANFADLDQVSDEARAKQVKLERAANGAV